MFCCRIKCQTLKHRLNSMLDCLKRQVQGQSVCRGYIYNLCAFIAVWAYCKWCFHRVWREFLENNDTWGFELASANPTLSIFISLADDDTRLGNSSSVGHRLHSGGTADKKEEACRRCFWHQKPGNYNSYSGRIDMEASEKLDKGWQVSPDSVSPPRVNQGTVQREVQWLKEKVRARRRRQHSTELQSKTSEVAFKGER